MKKLLLGFLIVFIIASVFGACSNNYPRPSGNLSDSDAISSSDATPVEHNVSEADVYDENDPYWVQYFIEGFKITMHLTKYTGDGWCIGYDESFLRVADTDELLAHYKNRVSNTDLLPSLDVDDLTSITRFVSIYNAGDKLDVYMDVEFIKNGDSGVLMTRDKQKLSWFDFNIGSFTCSGANALRFTTYSIDDWDGEVYVIYYVNTGDGCYRITTHYFIDASSGWGARFPAMVKTFSFS